MVLISSKKNRSYLIYFRDDNSTLCLNFDVSVIGSKKKTLAGSGE